MVLILLSLFLSGTLAVEDLMDLPNPRIVIVGGTGTGKSSLANALLGCDPQDKGCMFAVCNTAESCTKKTEYGVGPWLGTGINMTIVDTPGFGDAEGQEEELIEEMMGVLKNTIKYTHSILLLMKGDNIRIDTALQSMLRQMSSIFGSQFWEFLTIGVSFWKYSQAEIDFRNLTCTLHPDNCMDEKNFMSEVNTKLQEVFHLEKNFSFVFTDSFSQTNENPNDPIQQEHWIEETGKLWNIANSIDDPMVFKTIDDILEENAALKEKVDCLEEEIAGDISDLKERMEAVETKVDTPLGSIIPWVPKVNDSNHIETIPDGWVACDGSYISKGPWAGSKTPELNEGWFLKGAHGEGVLEFEQCQTALPNHTHIDNEHHHEFSRHNTQYGRCTCAGQDPMGDVTDGWETTSSTSGIGGVEQYETYEKETRPKNMGVTYIMRCW